MTGLGFWISDLKFEIPIFNLKGLDTSPTPTAF
jgi:hypothetical protein